MWLELPVCQRPYSANGDSPLLHVIEDCSFGAGRSKFYPCFCHVQLDMFMVCSNDTCKLPVGQRHILIVTISAGCEGIKLMNVCKVHGALWMESTTEVPSVMTNVAFGDDQCMRLLGEVKIPAMLLASYAVFNLRQGGEDSFLTPLVVIC